MKRDEEAEERSELKREAEEGFYNALLRKCAEGDGLIKIESQKKSQRK